MGTFASIDASGDGFLSYDEFNSYSLSPSSLSGDGVYSYRYGRFDRDGNGCWDTTEFTDYTNTYGGTGSYNTVDTNSNACISESEYSSYAKGSSGIASCDSIFTKYDTNGRGSWSREEFAVYQNLYGGVFQAIDSSQGGIISKNEWGNYCSSAATFTEYDTDGNGCWSSAVLHIQ